jgi:hypothetical protein
MKGTELPLTDVANSEAGALLFSFFYWGPPMLGSSAKAILNIVCRSTGMGLPLGGKWQDSLHPCDGQVHE